MANKQKDKINIGKKIISAILFFSFIFLLLAPIIFFPKKVTAQAVGASVPVTDTLVQGKQDTELAAKSSIWKLDEALKKLFESLKDAAWNAGKKAMYNMLNQMAYDTATWLASGAEGEGPMFYTDGWGTYLEDAADIAAGAFIEQLGSDLVGLNVCEPNGKFIINIGLALRQIKAPKKPDCTFKELIKNWSNFVNADNFLDKFSTEFDPTQNDILVAFKLLDDYQVLISKNEKAAEKERTEADGIKAVESGLGYKTINGVVNGMKILQKLTPAKFVDARAWAMLESTKPDWNEVTYGSIFGYALGTFIDTLAYKIIQRVFNEGLAALSGSSSSSSSDDDDSNYEDIYSEYAGTASQYAGTQAAQARFVDFLSAGMVSSGPYDVLNKLTICTSPNQPSPEECVLNQEFRLAIEQQVTVKEALKKGFLDGNAPFGFTAPGFQPSYLEGYPYRSLLILRAHRVIPVTWEIAAEIINRGFVEQKIYSLNNLIAEYDNSNSPFYHLIDEKWVLKIPDHYCNAEGYGPIKVTEDVTGGVDLNKDGDYKDSGESSPSSFISRSTYCADYQSCIDRDQQGNCIYGYCTEEKRIWDLQGDECPDYFNTCQTFTSRDGNTASYLKDTLVYNSCNIDNAGCRWYCQDFNIVDDVWICLNDGEQVLKSCTNVGGCNLSAACDIATGENFCLDEVNNASLTISSPCTAGSKWWDGDNCRVSLACQVEKDGVSCTDNGCEKLTNLLPNYSFETAAKEVGGLADSWIATDAGYFNRVSGGTERIYDGNNSIRFYNVGGPLATDFHASFNLPTGKDYTFSGLVYNRLNAGQIEIKITGDVSNVRTGIMSSVNNSWEEVGSDFTVGSSGNVMISVTVSSGSDGQVSGIAWFDNFRISESCITNPVTLTLTGAIDQDQSKLHFDRDAKECDQQSAGCSQFVRLKENLGTNIIPNSGFEIWDDANKVAGWQGSGFSKASAGNSFADDFGLQLAQDGQIRTEDYQGNTTLSAVRLGNSYFVSFYAKANSASGGTLSSSFRWVDGSSSLTMANSDQIKLSGDWQRFVMDEISIPAVGQNFELAFVNIGNGDIYLDNVQLEPVDFNGNYSSYKNYGSNNLAYLRQSPDYLSCHGYTLERPSPYVLDKVRQAQCVGETAAWRPDSCDATGQFCCHEIDPGECFNYAMYCESDEVGCQAYTPILGNEPMIPGVVAYNDYCPEECLGYDAYKQSTTYFESQQSLEYFIPKTADKCSADAAGCDEFTNLDEIAKGGEGREYYTYLRQCVVPSAAGSSCQNYYTWQGSDDSGYQLRVYNLSVASDGSPQEAIQYQSDDPASTAWLSEWCDDKTLGKNGQPVCCDGSEDIFTNPFCKEFYSTNNQIYYRIYDNTVSCSDNCHPFRKTGVTKNSAEAEINCIDSNGQWDGTACTYYAIPDQGVSCSAAAAGCREYRGNSGGNLYVALDDDFEDGDSVNWQRGEISSESLTVGGHSLKSQIIDLRPQVVSSWGNIANHEDGSASGYSQCSPDVVPNCDTTSSPTKYPCYDSARGKCALVDVENQQLCLADVGQSSCGVISQKLNPKKTYLISFWAKSSSSVLKDLAVEITDGNQIIGIKTANLSGEWNYYNFGPFVYDGLADSARLIFINKSTGAEFYLDNVEIKEIQDYVYVIKNSWTTPQSCDQNPYVTPVQSAPQFMLGCAQYADSYGSLHNLKSFSRLCREDVVGCEALIDVQNSTSPFQQEFNLGDDIGYINLSADKMIYMVNRSEFQCDATQKGCQLLGRPEVNRDNLVTGYSNAYIINDPDQYSTILCSNPEVGCEEFQTTNGYYYFKDPGQRLCEYAEIASQDTFAWVKSGSSTLSPEYCPISRSALGVIHPTDGWAGLCPEEFSGCVEFVDPVSDISVNQVFNPDFKQKVVATSGVPDGWDFAEVSNEADTLTQPLDLKQDTLYTLTFKNTKLITDKDSLSLEIVDCPGITSFDHSMVAGSGGGLQLPVADYTNDGSRRSTSQLPVNRQYSARFYTPYNLDINADCKLRITFSSSVDGAITQEQISNLITEISLKETGIYYTIANSVDETSCNGLVNPEKNCVLFNNRDGVNYRLSENDNSYLLFDADVSGPSVNSSIPVSACAGVCDSDTVLKVKPDRTCGQWLDCQTKVKLADSAGDSRDYCIDLAACDSWDEKGQCNNFVLPQRQNVNDGVNNNLTTYFSNNSRLANLSGYIQAGITRGDWSSNNDTIRGNYPYDLMPQIGEVSQIPNGNFEQVYPYTVRPLGWVSAEDDQYDPLKFFVLNDLLSASNSGVDIVEGAGVLQINAAALVKSELVEVFPDTEYMLSALVNTLNLAPISSQAMILIEDTYLSDESESILSGSYTLLDPQFENREFYALGIVAAESNWSQIIQKFTTGLDTTTLNLWLVNWIDNGSGEGPCLDNEGNNQECGNNNDCFIGAPFGTCDAWDPASQVGVCTKDNVCDVTGKSYFDKIELLPVLEVQDIPDSIATEDAKTYIARSCRIYAQADSLSCSYFDDQYIYQRGISGYCLEPDPLYPDVCLQWWPVDLIAGDFFDEYRGYDDRVPLYMCAQTRDDSFTDTFYYSDGELEGHINEEQTDALILNDFDTKLSEQELEAWQIKSVSVTTSIGHCDHSHNHERVTITIDNLQTVINAGGESACESKCGWTSGSMCYKASSSSFSVDLLIGEETIAGVCAYGFSFGCARSDAEMTIEAVSPYCSIVDQVVTPTLSNKAWVDRISNNSPYIVDKLNYIQADDYPPFGSMLPPEPTWDPYEWDGSEKSGIQPVYVRTADTSESRAGLPYSCLDSCIYPLNSFIAQTLNSIFQDWNGLVEGNNRLKRLFAKNYATWEWQGGYYCYDEAVGDFTADICQCPGSSCAVTPSSRSYCASKPGQTCTVTNCPIGSTCQATTGGTGTPRCVDNLGIIDDSAICCLATFGECKTETTYIAKCAGGDKEGNICDSSISCEVGDTCKEKPGEDNRYKPLDLENNDFFRTYAWRMPQVICYDIETLQYNKRSDRYLEDQNDYTDYCGIPPVISNIKLNDTASGPVVLTKSGSINLTFNVRVDNNQLPLKGYRVNWGDNTEDSVSGFSLRDLSNPSDPFVLLHSYSYYDILSKMDSSEIYCTRETGSLADWAVAYGKLPENSCAVRVKVFAIDNWGWCSGNYDADSACAKDGAKYGSSVTSACTSIPAYGFYGAACNSSANADTWVYYNGIMVIQESNDNL